MKPIVCIGELLIDFICTDRDVSLMESINYIKKPGGAPANVAAAISKLGSKAYFAGAVGNDAFGNYLESVLVNNQVETTMLKKSNNMNTTLAFVSLTKSGERDFSFFRGADVDYSISDIDFEIIEKSSIIHFGSATGFLGGALENTYLELMRKSHAEGKTISFDPNYRDAFWSGNDTTFIEKVNSILELVDIIKVSEEELALLSGTEDLYRGSEVILNKGAKLVITTLGKEGVYIANKNGTLKIGAPKIISIDSTGAGDAFVGGLLYKLNKHESISESIDDISKIEDDIKFANCVGALVCTKLGAMEALGELDKVMELFEATYN